MLPHSYQFCVKRLPLASTEGWSPWCFLQIRMSSDIQKLFPCQVVDLTQCETLLFLWTSHGLPVPASHTGSSSHSHLVQSTTEAENFSIGRKRQTVVCISWGSKHSTRGHSGTSRDSSTSWATRKWGTGYSLEISYGTYDYCIDVESDEVSR